VGTIAILTPSFALARRPFLRDVGFYVFSVLCLAVFLFDGDIKLWESLMLILIYLIYVCTVIIGRNIYQSRKKKRE
jgi:sodium/potassium/calcium exchanger 6